MKPVCLALLLVACKIEVATAPDASIGADASIDAPVEPKPAFAASAYMSGALAVNDTGLLATYLAGTPMPSKLSFSLTATGSTTSCGITVKPHFVMFSTGSTSTRYFKTVVIDVAASEMFEDKCNWDDAYVLAEIANQFGNVEIGFAQARFTEDRPYLDVFLDADKTFPNSTANITMAGGGVGWGLDANNSVGGTMVEPAPGTLLPAVYEF